MQYDHSWCYYMRQPQTSAIKVSKGQNPVLAVIETDPRVTA
jgi:hypothetical protein